MNKKENRGITLVALVITIIVLIILAGVSINAVMNGGLITNAKDARNEYDVAKQKEEVTITDFEVQTDFATKITRGYANKEEGISKYTPYLFRNGYLTGVIVRGDETETVKSLQTKLPEEYYVFSGGDIPAPIENPNTTPVATEMLLMRGETEESAQKVGTIIVFGDVNCSGAVNGVDPSSILNWLSGGSNINIVSADVNHDGIVNKDDYQYILDYSFNRVTIEQDVYALSLDELTLEDSETKRGNIIEDLRKKYTVEYITWEYNDKERTTDAITDTVDTTTIKDILDAISYEEVGIFRPSTREVFKKGNENTTTELVQEADMIVLIDGESIKDGVVEYDTDKLQIYIVKQ